MRYFIIVLLLSVLPLPAAAQTKINDETAKAYYDSCMGARDRRMSREAQDSLCECTSKKMQEKMSVEDVRTMGQNDQDGRLMLNKMMLDVYAPCMQEPLSELVHDRCMTEDRMSAPYTHKADLCACIGEKTGEWFTTGGRDLMAGVLEKNPNISDPFNPVLQTDAFTNVMLDNMISCVPARKGRK